MAEQILRTERDSLCHTGRPPNHSAQAEAQNSSAAFQRCRQRYQIESNRGAWRSLSPLGETPDHRSSTAVRAVRARQLAVRRTSAITGSIAVRSFPAGAGSTESLDRCSAEPQVLCRSRECRPEFRVEPTTAAQAAKARGGRAD